ncbi:RT1 class I histocompatibility antigen, AA alpha chain-like [Chanodichthys erythropterus]|uniref:RT1 class I histocompatibility antigen, AA alpha chain-like n=1 Tax=Chanodichthys erythropterus TaxID=933992 RepID=UPI00351DB07B
MNWISTFINTKQSSPDVHVFVRKAPDDDSNLVLTCLATGFYPRDVQINIRLYKTKLKHQTSSGIRPNDDETFQMRISVKIDRNHEGSYDCLLIHSSLTEPVTVKWDGRCSDCETDHTWIVIAGAVALAVIVIITGYCIYKQKRSNDAALATGRYASHTRAVCSVSLPHQGCTCGSLTSLARFLGAWLELPNLSRWLIRTVGLGYAIQFARRPPRFRGIHATMVGKDAPVMHSKIATLLAKGAIESVSPAEMKSGFYSLYFIVPKKTGGLRPILDLRALNRALHRLPFKMLTPKHIFECVRPLDWFAAIDLKDAYFHVSIFP